MVKMRPNFLQVVFPFEGVSPGRKKTSGDRTRNACWKTACRKAPGPTGTDVYSITRGMQMKTSCICIIKLGSCCVCDPVPVKLAKVLIFLAGSFNCIQPTSSWFDDQIITSSLCYLWCCSESWYWFRPFW